MITLRCRHGHHVTGHEDGSACTMKCIGWAFGSGCPCPCHDEED